MEWVQGWNVWIMQGFTEKSDFFLVEGSGGAGGGGDYEKPLYREELPKGEGAWTVCRFRGGGTWRKRGWCFWGCGGWYPNAHYMGALGGGGGARAELCWGLMGQDSLSSNMRL